MSHENGSDYQRCYVDFKCSIQPIYGLITVEQSGRNKLSTSFSVNAWSGIIRDLIVVGKCIAESLSACPVTLVPHPSLSSCCQCRGMHLKQGNASEMKRELLIIRIPFRADVCLKFLQTHLHPVYETFSLFKIEYNNEL